jgi:hypothetical protein
MNGGKTAGVDKYFFRTAAVAIQQIHQLIGRRPVKIAAEFKMNVLVVSMYKNPEIRRHGWTSFDKIVRVRKIANPSNYTAISNTRMIWAISCILHYRYSVDKP